ncbi:motile sperm domain-containing protein 2-like [Fopius arisanus]|uniref:Motile sperm domain-containing protein 2-like n=1 Tax=Fopius arisanus TaxID=64838 RepID=A0A9R1TQV8_9HYME|nr:PREDICTED: motile sperm domain-containing protein 2-like [Fopius arisanus]
MDLQQQIAELREKFFKKLEDETPSDERGFHPDDLTRIRTRDEYLKRWLEHTDFNVQESVNMLWSTCEWRRKVGANEITEDSVNREYLQDGVVFGYGKDRDGRGMFVIKSKLHVKGVRDFGELQKCIIYWFERLEREGNEQITLFFDMCEAGLSNMDMEFTKYLITLFKYYYPNYLNNIILLEMPWVLNAALKIIKSWLPAKATPKIKQVNKSGLKEFVDPSVALVCWGGENDYKFTFVPEIRNGVNSVNGKLDNKKVHFAEASPLSEQPSSGFGDQSTEDSMIAITPDVLSFNKEGQEIVGTIAVKNQTADKCISYKLKTTAPEKFRVRRSNGVLLPAQQVTMTISLQPGFNLRSLLHNDKFLIMCLPMEDAKMTAEELVDFWKTNEKSAEQHRVWCRDGTGETTSILSPGSSGSERTMDQLHTKLSHLEECHGKLHKELRTLKHVMIISIIWTVVAAIAIVYILRLDIGQIITGDQSCHLHRE